jgi:hypothetical protein
MMDKMMETLVVIKTMLTLLTLQPLLLMQGESPLHWLLQSWWSLVGCYSAALAGYCCCYCHY